MKLKIGNVELQTNVMLAPIAGHCDLPFRLVARQLGGVGIAFTDLLCPHGIFKQNVQTQWLTATNENDRPLGMQLYGNDPVTMARAAEWSVNHGATIIDINMGCPVDKVTKTFAGSMMLCTPDNTVAVAEAILKQVGDRVPVTAKTRLGYCHDELTAPDLSKRLIRSGIAAITIHGRTAHQRFKGVVDLDGIKRVVETVHEAGNGKIPCVGNGDIKTPFDARTMIDHTGCDGVMIARAALGCPWILRDTAYYIDHGELPAELTLRERVECVRQHFHHLANMRDPIYARNIIRQKIAGYSKTMGHIKPLREGIRTLENPENFDEIIDQYLNDHPEKADEVPVTWETRREALGAIALPAAA